MSALFPAPVKPELQVFHMARREMALALSDLLNAGPVSADVLDDVRATTAQIEALIGLLANQGDDR